MILFPGMTRLLGIFFQALPSGRFLGSISTSSDCETVPGPVRGKLSSSSRKNDNVYVMYQPEGDPALDIVFFHGLLFEDCPDIHYSSWLSRDKSVCWPADWLPSSFPRARILTVAYDSSILKTHNKGRFDFKLLGENLLANLSLVNVGTRCPFIFVGHCLGGLVMKQICMEAVLRIGISNDTQIESFLQNLRGMFYFGTSHLGSELLSQYVADQVRSCSSRSVGAGSVTTYVGALSEVAARLQGDFDKVSRKYNWETSVVSETLETPLGRYRGVLTTESSARVGVNDFYSDGSANHHNVNKLESAKSSSYQLLLRFIVKCSSTQCASQATEPYRSVLPFQEDPTYVPLDGLFIQLRSALESSSFKVVNLHGGPGTGKTCMAKHIAQYYNGGYQQELSLSAASSESQHWIPEFVIFLYCGDCCKENLQEKVAMKQSELISSLVIEFERRRTCLGTSRMQEARWRETSVAKLEGLPSPEKLRRLLEKQRGLIVLDEVWRPEVLWKLTEHRESGVRYLVTSQIIDVASRCTAMNMEMPETSGAEALTILIGQLQIPQAISTSDIMQIRGQMIRLIRTSEYHPLTLVTYASVMRQGTDICNPREWQEPLEDLITFLDGEESADGFPRSLMPSMIMMLNLLSSQALNLLILAAVFDDPYGVPEVLLKMFCKRVKIKPAEYQRLRNDLRNRCLIQLNRKLGGIQHQMLGYFSIHKLTKLNRKLGGIQHQMRRCYSIHRLRKEIILEKQKDKVGSVISLLQGGASNSGDAIFEEAVCVAYGGLELRAATAPRLQRMLQARAVPAPRNSLNYSIDARELAARAPIFLRESIDPLLSLLDLDHLRDAHVLVKQVIANRVCRGEFGDKLLSELLRLPHWETTEAVSQIVGYMRSETFYVSYRYQAVLQAVSAHFGRTLGTLLEVLKDERVSSDGDRQELILAVLLHNFQFQLKGFNASVASFLAFTMRSPSLRLSCLGILEAITVRDKRAALFLGEEDVILESLETCLNDCSAASECFTISLEIIYEFSAVKGIGNKLAGFPGIIRHLEQHMEQYSLRTTERLWSDDDWISVRALGNLSYDPRIRMMVADNLAIIVPSLICFACDHKCIVPLKFHHLWTYDIHYQGHLLALFNLLGNIALGLELAEGSVQRLAKYPGLEQCFMWILQIAPRDESTKYSDRYIHVAVGRAFTILYPQTMHPTRGSFCATFWMGCALMQFDRNLLERALAALEAGLGLNTPAFDYHREYSWLGARWNDFYLKKILIQRCIYQVKTKMGDFCGALEDVELMLKSLYQLGTPEWWLIHIPENLECCSIIPLRVAYMKPNIDRAVLRILLRDLPGASSDFDFCICSLNSLLDVERLHGFWSYKVLVDYLETMLYECLKFRGYVKYLLHDKEAARQDAESAIAIRNSSFHPLHMTNSRYYTLDIREDLFFRACYQEPITYLEYHF